MEPKPRKQKDSVHYSLAPRPPSKITMETGNRATAQEAQEAQETVTGAHRLFLLSRI